eukprot:3718718-Prymnesium_polylepis.2
MLKKLECRQPHRSIERVERVHAHPDLTHCLDAGLLHQPVIVPHLWRVRGDRSQVHLVGHEHRLQAGPRQQGGERRLVCAVDQLVDFCEERAEVGAPWRRWRRRLDLLTHGGPQAARGR